ncbi:MAG TPA: EAL domain-containing protein [Burkholderiaceae bacterium]
MATSINIRMPQRALLMLAIALPLFYVLFTGAAIYQDRESTLEQADSNVRNISATLNAHAMRTFAEADTKLQDAIAEINRRGLKLSGEDLREIHAILLRNMQNRPQLVVMTAIDVDGWIRASTTNYPLQAVDVRDREYFRHLATHAETGLFLSRPIKSRSVAGKWSIPLARRINRPDGSLKMIVELSIDMRYFDQLYRTLELGKDGRLLLVRTDGWVEMESPLTERVMDMNLTDAELFQRYQKMLHGVYHTKHSMLDATSRVIGYAGSAQFPLIAIASMSRDNILESWYRRSWAIAAIGAVSVSLLLALLRFLWFRLQDLVSVKDDLARQNTALANSRAQYQELVDGIDGIVWEADLPSFCFTYVSGNAGTISGYPSREWLLNPHFWDEKLSIGADVRTITPSPSIDGPAVLEPIEHCLTAPDGRKIWLRSNLMVTGAGQKKVQLRGVTVDITKQKQSERELFEAIHVDALTGLPNRGALTEHITHALAIAKNSHALVALLLMDLDNFSNLNDTLGHENGDRLLVLVAKRLHAGLAQTETLARVGGDAFGLLMEEVDRSGIKVEQQAERLHAAMRNPFEINGKDLYISVSIGIALFPQDGTDWQSLACNADTALHRAKAAGRNCWQYFDNSMAHRVGRRVEIEMALRQALEREEFFLQFQPQRSLESGNVVGAEALLRWERTGFGMVSPSEFVPVAEETGLIVALGDWVMRKACAQAVEWQRDQHLTIRMAVNVASVQLRQPDFVKRVRTILEQTGLSPNQLELEITEGCLVGDVGEAVEKLSQIRAMGVAFAIDDFGTGYSSLAYLNQLPLDRLKIDQSFVRGIPHNANDCALARAIIAMAKNLKLDVIAEGVETPAQIDFLRAEGCGEIQGFLLSPPISADAFVLRFPVPAE